MLSAAQLVQVGRRALVAYREDELGMLAAALAFAAFASLFPLILLLVALFSLILPRELAEQWIIDLLLHQVPSGSDTQFLVDVLTDVIRARGAGTGLAAAVSLITLAFAASGVFNTLRTAFNRIGGQTHAP